MPRTAGASDIAAMLEGDVAGKRRISWAAPVREDGSFLLDGSALAGCRMRATHPEETPGEWVAIEPPFPMRVALRLPADTGIAGGVLTDSGAPMPGAIVLIHAPELRSWDSTESDDSGAPVPLPGASTQLDALTT